MAINDLNAFLFNYFTAHHCEILSNHDGVLRIKLTEDMDRALMNRPFYWHYIKKMGQPGEPMQLSLNTNPSKSDPKAEWIHFGSPRLQQIINHLRMNEKYTKLFQSVNTVTNTALYPWLVINLKVSYKGQHKRDELFSVGLHLVNGMMKVEMMDILNTYTLKPTISDYCYTISPLIKIKSGFKRIESVIDHYIENQTHEWAQESFNLLNEELTLLEHFYDTKNEEEQQQIEKEKKELLDRYHPMVSYEVINGGLFYLAEESIK
ncbi:YqhG family protein [Virgibacillus kimchii]